jgi:hypothetical protein
MQRTQTEKAPTIIAECSQSFLDSYQQTAAQHTHIPDFLYAHASNCNMIQSRVEDKETATILPELACWQKADT